MLAHSHQLSILPVPLSRGLPDCPARTICIPCLCWWSNIILCRYSFVLCTWAATTTWIVVMCFWIFWHWSWSLIYIGCLWLCMIILYPSRSCRNICGYIYVSFCCILSSSVAAVAVLSTIWPTPTPSCTSSQTTPVPAIDHGACGWSMALGESMMPWRWVLNICKSVYSMPK